MVEKKKDTPTKGKNGQRPKEEKPRLVWDEKKEASKRGFFRKPRADSPDTDPDDTHSEW